jgi:hypothetical protein
MLETNPDFKNTLQYCMLPRSELNIGLPVGEFIPIQGQIRKHFGYASRAKIVL